MALKHRHPLRPTAGAVGPTVGSLAQRRAAVARPRRRWPTRSRRTWRRVARILRAHAARRLGGTHAVQVAARRRLERPQPPVHRSHGRRARRRADHRERRLLLARVAGGGGLRAGAARAEGARRRDRPAHRVRRRHAVDLPRRPLRRRADRHRARAQWRGLLLAEPRLRPLRRQGQHGPRAVVRRARRRSTRAASGWPTSMARAPPTSSTSRSTGVRIYFNQSGNSWSPARALAQFPASGQPGVGGRGRSARQRHRVPGLVLAAAQEIRAGRCATSI